MPTDAACFPVAAALTASGYLRVNTVANVCFAKKSHWVFLRAVLLNLFRTVEWLGGRVHVQGGQVHPCACEWAWHIRGWV